MRKKKYSPPAIIRRNTVVALTQAVGEYTTSVFVLTSFERLLWSVTELTHGKMSRKDKMTNLSRTAWLFEDLLQPLGTIFQVTNSTETSLFASTDAILNWFFWLPLRRACNSAYDSEFDFHLVIRALTTPTAIKISRTFCIRESPAPRSTIWGKSLRDEKKTNKQNGRLGDSSQSF